jgi:F-type H+-transporting ATPase subunit epsilon
MSSLHLKIITPKKIVMEEEIKSINVPSEDGELTILPRHMNLFCLLKEGIIKIKFKEQEDYLAIGGGYLETDGENINVLVTRAYGQDEIDEKMTEKAVNEAKQILSQSKDKQQLIEATSLLRKSMLDMKLLKKRKPPRSY